MPLLRRRDEPAGTRYQMREKLFAIGDDFWVETEGGQRAFKVDGKALRVRSTFVLESPSGEELFKIQEKKLRVRDTMTIEHNGDTVATVPDDGGQGSATITNVVLVAVLPAVAVQTQPTFTG